ncbi:MAG: NmrA family NAD(P)-binding protein [Planctomycetes bacterium]|nr:NmrA family NAD(P)-binding protein [Planctomycetota bacterium]
MSSQNPILVIGSTGKTGRRIVRRLTDLGLPIREGSRRSDPPFDWDRPETWAPALDGVDTAFVSFFPDLAVPGAPAAIERLTELAKAASVRRLVLLSGRGERNAERCEEIVRQSGLGFTLIRASWFAQNFDEGVLRDAVLAGTIAMPAGDVREPFVDVEDIADVAVAALTDPTHDGRLYELTGPRLMSFTEVAAELSKATGRPVRYAPISSEEFRAALTADAGPEFANMLTELCAEVLDGRNERLDHGVREALGREPRDFADYAEAAAAAGAWSTATREVG